MRAGELDHFVRIERDTGSGVDPEGEPVAVWTTFAEVWAKRRDTRGREYFAGTEAPGQLTAEATAVFTTYWIEGLEMAMRLVDTFDDREYDILAWGAVGGRHDGMEIAAKARVP